MLTQPHTDLLNVAVLKGLKNRTQETMNFYIFSLKEGISVLSNSILRGKIQIGSMELVFRAQLSSPLYPA